MKNIFLFENLVNIFKNTKLIIKFPIIICFLFAQINIATSQDSDWEKIEGFNKYIYKVYSENQNYNIISISQSHLFNYFNIEQKSNYGSTYIQRSEDDSVQYEFNGYFEFNYGIQNMFLSNDGSIFAYITSSYARINSNYLLIYKKGELLYQIDLNKLILKKADSKRDFEFYNNSSIRVFPEDTKDYFGEGLEDTTSNNMRRFIYKKDADSSLIIADKYPTFIHNDTLFIISNDLDLISIDLRSASINKKLYFENYNHIKTIASSNMILSKEYYFKKELTDIPDEKILGDSIAKILKMKNEVHRKDIFKYYFLSIEGYLYKNGSFKIYEMKNETLLPDSNLKNIVEKIKFNSEEIPEYSDRWYVKSAFHFRNPNDSISMNEREIEKELIASKDTLNGFYIPQDIYDAMPRLDSLLEVKDREEYKNLKDRFEIYKYHHTLGMALRNRWGLWQGSKLYKYFKNRGINHPDDMSGILMEAYWCYLNDSTFRYPFSQNIKYKLDSNLVLNINRNQIFDKDCIGIGAAQIVTKDFKGNYILFPAFSKSEMINFVLFEEDTSISKYNHKYSDYSCDDFIDSLPVFYKKFYSNEISLDSILLFKCNSFWNFKFFNAYSDIRKADTNEYWDIEGYKLFLKISKSEIDSLDMIFVELNKKIRSENPNSRSSDETKFHNSILNEYLKNKISESLYIIRYEPYIKFDFKEFKKSRNLIKK